MGEHFLWIFCYTMKMLSLYLFTAMCDKWFFGRPLGNGIGKSLYLEHSKILGFKFLRAFIFYPHLVEGWVSEHIWHLTFSCTGVSELIMLFANDFLFSLANKLTSKSERWMDVLLENGSMYTFDGITGWTGVLISCLWTYDTNRSVTY